MLTFAETAVRLVLNVTRASVIARAVKSKRMADFATVGRLELSVPGGLNAKGEGEIVIRRAVGKAVSEINDELYDCSFAYPGGQAFPCTF